MPLHNMPRRAAGQTSRAARRGFSFLELLVVVAILGILASVGLARYGRPTLGNFGAKANARKIGLDLHQARRRAIATGDNHYVKFEPSSGPATQFTVYRRLSGGDVAVEATRTLPTGVTVTPNHAEPEFSFEGTALATYSIAVAGSDRSWTISVLPATGAIRVNED